MVDVSLVNLNLMYQPMEDLLDRQVYLPLGILYLAAALERAGYEVEVIDYQLADLEDPFAEGAFARAVRPRAPIVGLSSMGNLLPFAVLGARELKRANPDTVVILGGAGPSPVARGLVETFPFVDFAFRGESEESFVGLVRHLKTAGPSPELPPTLRGFCHRSRRGRPELDEAPRIRDLDALPRPAFHLVDVPRYDAAPSVITSRGCPFRCGFCTETALWGHEVVFRSVAAVLDEIEVHRRDYGRRMVLLQDDQFTLDKKRVTAFCHGLRRRGLDIQWKCFGRIDLVDDEMMAEMAAAGCVQLRFGVESGSNAVLARLHKGFTIEQATAVVQRALRFFPSVHASFIWGFPFETWDDFTQTLRAVRWLDRCGATVLPFLYSPLPGSAVAEEFVEQLDFSAGVVPHFVLSGSEVARVGHQTVPTAHRYLYDFIEAHPRLFSGFFHHDHRGNVLPKLQHVVRHGFWGRRLREGVPLAIDR